MQSSDKNCSRCAELERELAEANRDVVNLHECLRQAALHEDAIPSSTRRNLAPCGCASLGQCVGAPVGCGRDYFAVSATLFTPALPIGWSAKLVSTEPMVYEIRTPYGARVAQQDSAMPNILFELVHAAVTSKAVTIEQMVDRFLAWSLPKDFMPDCGIKFTPLNHPNSWPIGTNLLTADQAKAMLLHLLGNDVSSTPAAWLVERDHLGIDGYGNLRELTFMDATAPEFWVHREIPDGYKVTPLYAIPSPPAAFTRHPSCKDICQNPSRGTIACFRFCDMLPELHSAAVEASQKEK